MPAIPKHLAVACSSILLIAALAGCSEGAESSLDPSVTESSGPNTTELTIDASRTTVNASSVSELVNTVASPPSTATTTGDPCHLLTATIASQALGTPVGDKITQAGEANVTCGYRPADLTEHGFVSLTLYEVAGSEAVLDAASAQFPDSESVDGVGDAARVSVQGQAIGVLVGSSVFAIGLFPQQANGQLVPVTKDQLIALASAVLAG